MLRVKIGADFGGSGDQHDRDLALCGEQVEWGIAIPWAFRALALPSNHVVMPAVPVRGDDVFVATAYWCPLIHLLRYSLGWLQPGKGLRWWYDAGRPLDGPQLALIHDLWDNDGQLDWLAAWLWTRPADDLSNFEGVAAPHVLASATAAEGVGAEVRWLEEQRRLAEDHGGSNPLTGGSDPLHLSVHWTGPLEEPARPAVFSSDGATRQATLVLTSMTGWYRALADAGATLPALGGHSWRVQVLVPSVGSLGTYRRSWDTGIWFSSRHRIHARGN